MVMKKKKKAGNHVKQMKDKNSKSSTKIDVNMPRESFTTTQTEQATTSSSPSSKKNAKVLSATPMNQVGAPALLSSTAILSPLSPDSTSDSENSSATMQIKTETVEIELCDLVQIMPSTSLIPSFGLLESSKIVDTPPVKIKIEPSIDRSSAQIGEPIETSETGDNYIEIITVLKPVKKTITEEVHNWDEDIVIVGESIFEKVPDESTLSPEIPLVPNLKTEESLCDTAPSSEKVPEESIVPTINESTLSPEIPLVPNLKTEESLCDTAPSSPVNNVDNHLPSVPINETKTTLIPLLPVNVINPASPTPTINVDSHKSSHQNTAYGHTQFTPEELAFQLLLKAEGDSSSENLCQNSTMMQDAVYSTGLCLSETEKAKLNKNLLGNAFFNFDSIAELQKCVNFSQQEIIDNQAASNLCEMVSKMFNDFKSKRQTIDNIIKDIPLSVRKIAFTYNQQCDGVSHTTSSRTISSSNTLPFTSVWEQERNLNFQKDTPARHTNKKTVTPNIDSKSNNGSYRSSNKKSENKTSDQFQLDKMRYKETLNQISESQISPNITVPSATDAMPTFCTSQRKRPSSENTDNLQLQEKKRRPRDNTEPQYTSRRHSETETAQNIASADPREKTNRIKRIRQDAPTPAPIGEISATNENENSEYKIHCTLDDAADFVTRTLLFSECPPIPSHSQHSTRNIKVTTETAWGKIDFKEYYNRNKSYSNSRDPRLKSQQAMQNASVSNQHTSQPAANNKQSSRINSDLFRRINVSSTVIQGKLSSTPHVENILNDLNNPATRPRILESSLSFPSSNINRNISSAAQSLKTISGEKLLHPCLLSTQNSKGNKELQNEGNLNLPPSLKSYQDPRKRSAPNKNNASSSSSRIQHNPISTVISERYSPYPRPVFTQNENKKSSLGHNALISDATGNFPGVSPFPTIGKVNSLRNCVTQLSSVPSTQTSVAYQTPINIIPITVRSTRMSGNISPNAEFNLFPDQSKRFPVPTTNEINLNAGIMAQTSPNADIQPRIACQSLNKLPPSIPTNAEYRRFPDQSRRLQKTVSLVPRSLKEDIGHNLIVSTSVYLIIIEWSVDCFLQYETVEDLIQYSPPILPDNVQVSQVRNTYRDERDYYNTYFKLLLMECWYSIYSCWKDLRNVTQFTGKITSSVTRDKFNEYIVEIFARDSETEFIPRESYIVLLRFTTRNKECIDMLGYVKSSINRRYEQAYDHNNEAFLTLKSSSNNILKYKQTIHTVFKSHDIDTSEFMYVKKLFNIRKYLQQNDAICNLSKSCLCEAVLAPITSQHKLSISMPTDSSERDANLNYVCERILDPDPLLALINYSLPTSDKMAAISYMIRRLKRFRPNSKVILCSKSENTLSTIADDLQNYMVVFVGKDKIPGLFKNSLYVTVDKMLGNNSPKFGDLLGDERKKSVSDEVLQQCDVILVLLLGCQESIDSLTKTLDVTCCILDEAHHCTEPESIVPLSFGTKKFILLGNKTLLCDVSPVTTSYEYNRSLFNRASF